MQTGEVVGFNDYTNYRISSQVVSREGLPKTGVKRHRKLTKQEKRNRRINRIKMRILRTLIVVMFFLIVCIGAIMTKYVIESRFSNYDASGEYDSNINTYVENNDKEVVDSSDAEDESWALVLVNKDNPIPHDYDVELTTLFNGVQVDSRIYPELQKMFDDMRSGGIYPVVGEGYRTSQMQKRMMQDKIDAYIAEGYSKTVAKHQAKKYVAKAGTSEHELGIALDINASAESSTTHDEVYQWLYNNAYKYGFIQRYPEGKEDITGIDYEPWHYRYVGKQAAKEIYESGITLEEYLK